MRRILGVKTASYSKEELIKQLDTLQQDGSRDWGASANRSVPRVFSSLIELAKSSHALNQHEMAASYTSGALVVLAMMLQAEDS